jgi:hypothetical protein
VSQDKTTHKEDHREQKTSGRENAEEEEPSWLKSIHEKSREKEQV